MPRLSEVLGGVMAQIAKGRAQADAATLELARHYRNTDLLQDFPIPRLALDEIVIDLKVAIAESPRTKHTISPNFRDQIVQRLEKTTKELPSSDESLKSLISDPKAFRKVWQPMPRRFGSEMQKLLPDGAEIQSALFAQTAMLLIRTSLKEAVTNPTSKIEQKKARKFLEEDGPRIEARLLPELESIFSAAAKSAPAGDDSLNVLVTAAELESIPQEKITTMRLVLRESDRSWTSYQDQNGEMKEKIVPN